MSVFRKFKIKQLSNYDRYIINREPVNMRLAVHFSNSVDNEPFVVDTSQFEYTLDVFRGDYLSLGDCVLSKAAVDFKSLINEGAVPTYEFTTEWPKRLKDTANPVNTETVSFIAKLYYNKPGASAKLLSTQRFEMEIKKHPYPSETDVQWLGTLIRNDVIKSLNAYSSAYTGRTHSSISPSPNDDIAYSHTHGYILDDLGDGAASEIFVNATVQDNIVIEDHLHPVAGFGTSIVICAIRDTDTGITSRYEHHHRVMYGFLDPISVDYTLRNSPILTTDLYNTKIKNANKSYSNIVRSKIRELDFEPAVLSDLEAVLQTKFVSNRKGDCLIIPVKETWNVDTADWPVNALGLKGFSIEMIIKPKELFGDQHLDNYIESSIIAGYDIDG
jgi:hypothetical protein